MARREREGGGGGRSDEAVAMLPRGGRAADETTRGGGGAERVVRGVLEADDSMRGGGADDARQACGGRPNDTITITGTAALATVPAPGGVDDADDVPMAVGGGTATAEQPPTAARQHPQWK